MRRALLIGILLLAGCQSDDLHACDAVCGKFGIKEFAPVAKNGALVCKCYTADEFCSGRSK